MKKYIIYSLLFCSVSMVAQKERSMARKGNRFFADSAYTEAEVAYLRALDENPNFEEAQYNLASATIKQNKFEEAIEQLDIMAKTTDDKVALGELYHNMGNAYLGKYQQGMSDQQKAAKAGEDLDKSIEAYKKALRNNPSDDQTRYNLAFAQKLKKEGPPPEEQQQPQDQDKQDQDQNKDEQQQQQDQQPQDQQDQQDQQQQQPDKISKEDAEKILNAMMQEEKELQEDQKEKQQAKARTQQVEKDW